MHNGAYHILRPLSKGGMGMIYLAEDLGAFRRQCVIKEMQGCFDPANPQYDVQVCKVLEYLGGLSPLVVHHDIQPANIIVDNATQ